MTHLIEVFSQKLDLNIMAETLSTILALVSQISHGPCLPRESYSLETFAYEVSLCISPFSYYQLTSWNCFRYSSFSRESDLFSKVKYSSIKRKAVNNYARTRGVHVIAVSHHCIDKDFALWQTQQLLATYRLDLLILWLKAHLWPQRAGWDVCVIHSTVIVICGTKVRIRDHNFVSQKTE
jgi:hypothetical protein